MSGKWDKKTEYDSLHELLVASKYFDANEMVTKLASDGVELQKLPEHFTIDDQSKKILVEMINSLVDNMQGIDSMADTTMGFLRGYSEGIREATQDKKVIDL